MKNLCTALAAVLAVAPFAACSSADPGAGDEPMEEAGQTGGTSEAGSQAPGGSAAGGSKGTGGRTAAAGATGAGGSKATGGSTATGGGTSGSGGSTGTGGSAGTGGAPPTTQTPGTWVGVTPAGASGATFFNALAIDPVNRQNAWVGLDHVGIWKSTDYGGTWSHVSTGTIENGTGAAYLVADPNPNRDPETEPTLYALQSYGGAGGIWKSTDGGVTWSQTWNNNVYGTDGTTNIYSDVGGDLGSVEFTDPADNRHLIASLHGYWGSGGNNGVFETTNGGQTWRVHLSSGFSFSPHNSCLMPAAPHTWLVTPNTLAGDMNIYRTTDDGATWNTMGSAPARGIGRRYCRVGSALYSGTDYNGNGIFKSTDQGASWHLCGNAGGTTAGVAATATTIYTLTGGVPHFMHAKLLSDAVWTDDGVPPGMKAANFLGSTFDGVHYILISSSGTDGLWRYVEPAQ